MSINTNAPLTGGGDISANRTLDINLDSTDLGVDGSNQLYVKDAGIDHDSTTNVHQDVTASASPTFANVTLNNSPTNGSHATTKDYVDNLVQGVAWQEAVIDRIDFTTSEPATPNDGDRYINTGTGNSSSTTQPVTADHIYEWDSTGSTWVETIPEEGMAVWVEDEDVTYVYNGASWSKMSTVYNHNNLSGLQGGAADQYYHLDSTEFGYLDGQDQSVYTTSSPTFNDLTISTPSNIYNLNHDSFSGYVANEHIDWTADQGATNINDANIAETAVTQHEGAINHDALTGFVGNEHVDHSTVTITGGGILSGGGDLTANRTISLNHGDVDHDQTTNFVANEHIDHSSVSISTGNGLSGGGDLTSSRTINIDNDTETGATVAPLSITANGLGVTVDNSSITHTSGEITVSLVDGGAF